MFRWFLLLVSCILCSACYNQASQTPDAWSLTDKQQDSISFYTTHHYTQNFNFVVKGDSLVLHSLRSDQNPEVDIAAADCDSCVIAPGERVVVADIIYVPTDTIDSVWVKLAHDQSTQGWIQESRMLPNVKPDDPISWFIDTFSDVHLLYFLALFVVFAAAYSLLLLKRRKALIVHINDIDSIFPMLLALLVATSAVAYASIQLFDPDSWRHFYYHPTLNPFALPPKLSSFMTFVWAIVIVTIAAVDDVFRRLAVGEALLYTLGLAAVCAVDYVVFSISTLYYIGYPLLVVYFVYAIRMYIKNSLHAYRCGNCGKPLRQLGRCPYCGTINVES
ncbi:MAG: zinc ribbon domain-containing protein [Prevotella sp.]